MMAWVKVALAAVGLWAVSGEGLGKRQEVLASGQAEGTWVLYWNDTTRKGGMAKQLIDCAAENEKWNATEMWDEMMSPRPFREKLKGNKLRKVKAFRMRDGEFGLFHGHQATVECLKRAGISCEKDGIVHASRVPAGLDRIDQENLPLDNQIFKLNYTGKDVVIYVVDSGLQADHREFCTDTSCTSSRAILGPNFSTDTDNFDNSGHGTHVAGIAAGLTFGVAPGATVVGLKALGADGSGSFSDIIDAVLFAFQDMQSRNLDSAVINLSLGGRGRMFALENALRSFAAQGGLVTIAAGNDSIDACQFTPANAGGSASRTGIVTVASSVSDTDFRSGFSNFGTCCDLFAPGSNIESARASRFRNDLSRTLSGTSMASPKVAGALAAYLEASKTARQDNKIHGPTALLSMLANTNVNKIRDPVGTPNRLLGVQSMHVVTDATRGFEPSVQKGTRSMHIALALVVSLLFLGF